MLIERASAARTRCAVWAGVLVLLSFVASAAAGSFALRERTFHAAVALAHGSDAAPPDAGDRTGLLADYQAAQRYASAVAKSTWHRRAFGGDREAALLRAASAEHVVAVAQTARAWLDARSRRFSPSGEPSPYDATAPPSPVQRDG